MTLKEKHVLVTGSSRGIGRGIALKLAESGAHVVVHYYQNEDAAKNTLAKIRECGSDGILVQADVCRTEEVSRIFKQVETEFGSLDIFVSNARNSRRWRSRWTSGTPPWTRKRKPSWWVFASPHG